MSRNLKNLVMYSGGYIFDQQHYKCPLLVLVVVFSMYFELPWMRDRWAPISEYVDIVEDIVGVVVSFDCLDLWRGPPLFSAILSRGKRGDTEPGSLLEIKISELLLRFPVAQVCMSIYPNLK